MLFLGIFNKDGCGGWLKLRYPEHIRENIAWVRKRYDDAYYMLFGVLIDVGFNTAINESSINLYDYIHYIDVISRTFTNALIYYIVPDSHNPRQHINYATALLDLVRQKGIKPLGVPVLVMHYFVDFKDVYRLFLTTYKRVFGKVVAGIPGRVLTASWRGGNPLKIQCHRKPAMCIRYIENTIMELHKYGFTDYHILGINRKVYKWLVDALNKGDGVGQLNISIMGDSDNYRLAVSQRLRVRDYGKGKYMLHDDRYACDWFEEWLKV